MELREALSQIADIRRQMAQGQVFRGYRAATTAFSGVMAVAAGIVQMVVLPEAGRAPVLYAGLWISAALACLIVVAIEMIIRTRRSQSPLQRQLTLLAVEQFMPSVVAGALLTYILCEFAQEQVWMLPGLWMMLFSLGVFASARLLPRGVFAVAGFYLIAGVLALVLTHDPARMVLGSPARFSPWLMAVPFAIGQGAIAIILYVTLERDHG